MAKESHEIQMATLTGCHQYDGWKFHHVVVSALIFPVLKRSQVGLPEATGNERGSVTISVLGVGLEPRSMGSGEGKSMVETFETG